MAIAHTTVDAPRRAHVHPLENLSAEEIEWTSSILERHGLVTESVRFVYVGLDEPHKREVFAFEAGDAERVDRRVRVVLLDLATGAGTDIVVNLTAATVESQAVLSPDEGQAAILDEEFGLIDPIVRADAGWQEAIRARGADPDKVVFVPLSAGEYGYEEENGRRIVRTLFFLQEYPEDSCWAHPVDGLCAYVDLTAGRVIELVDEARYPIPAETGDYLDPEYRGPERTTLKAIDISQPDGPSFEVDGEIVSWQNWRFRVGFDPREGLILRQLSFADGGVDRSIIYRASIAEMVVPYGDPSPVRFWQNYFDTGEYMFARYTNSLELGCDCVGEIHYFDAVLADERGGARTIKNAICMHEEDTGILWKHTDPFSGTSETRRQRRLVISFFTTVGNYDYGFYWYLYLDGTIECEAKLSGILFTSAFRGKDYPYASEVAPGLGAPFHQHLFSARLDMAVDGTDNTVQELQVKRLPIGPDNPAGNAISYEKSPIVRESDAARNADASVGRVWHITNPTHLNRYGEPTSYVLIPEETPSLLADPASSVAARAPFTTKQLWVTQYDPRERYTAGDHPNRHPGGAGITAYQKADRPLENTDIVLWHTFGPTHFPRPEDWPVMPVDPAKFTLKPFGFFERNPTLDVPRATSSAHCEHHRAR